MSTASPGSTPRARLLAATTVSRLSGLMYSMGTGGLTGILTILADKHHLNLNDAQQGRLVASVLVGAFLGSMFLTNFLVFRLGRKWTFLTASGLYTVGNLLALSHPDYTRLLLLRAVVGLGVGIASATAPAYIKSVVPPEKESSAGFVFQRWLVLGFPLVVLPALYTHWAWQTQLTLTFLPGALLALVAWLATYQAHGPGQQGHTVQQLSFAAILRLLLRRSDARRRLIVAIMINVLQQLTLINGVLYYAPGLLGGGRLSPLNATLIVDGVNILITWIVGFFVKRFSRFSMMTTGMVVIVIGLLLVSSGFFLHQPTVVLIGSVVFILGFGYGQGLVWQATPEALPDNMQLGGPSIATGAQWIANIGVVLAFPVLRGQHSLGPAKTFLVFGVVAMFSVAFYMFNRTILQVTAATSGSTVPAQQPASLAVTRPDLPVVPDQQPNPLAALADKVAELERQVAELTPKADQVTTLAERLATQDKRLAGQAQQSASQLKLITAQAGLIEALTRQIIDIKVATGIATLEQGIEGLKQEFATRHQGIDADITQFEELLRNLDLATSDLAVPDLGTEQLGGIIGRITDIRRQLKELGEKVQTDLSLLEEWLQRSVSEFDQQFTGPVAEQARAAAEQAGADLATTLQRSQGKFAWLHEEREPQVISDLAGLKDRMIKEIIQRRQQLNQRRQQLNDLDLS